MHGFSRRGGFDKNATQRPEVAAVKIIKGKFRQKGKGLFHSEKASYKDKGWALGDGIFQGRM